jgi:hypothetical protein
LIDAFEQMRPVGRGDLPARMVVLVAAFWENGSVGSPPRRKRPVLFCLLGSVTEVLPRNIRQG